MERWEYKSNVYDSQADENDLNAEAQDGWEVAFKSVVPTPQPTAFPEARVHILLKRRKT